MRIFEDQEFYRFDDRDSGATFADLEFRRCTFRSCLVSITDQPKKRTTIRNVTLLNCEVRSCGLRTALLDTVVLDGLKAGDVQFVRGCAYRHVVLRGRVGKITLGDFVPPIRDNSEDHKQRVQLAFRDANAKFYESVDWALDIREAEPMELSIMGVPGHLIRRDPRTQCLVKREKAVGRAWEHIGLRGVAQIVLNDLATKTFADRLIIASKRSKSFEEDMEDIKRLRDAGIAELD